MKSILTVNSYAQTQDLTVLATVKQELGITGTAEDAQLAIWIRQSSSMIANYCNRTFGLEVLNETFRLETTAENLLLSRFPLTTISSITENDIVLTAADYEADSVIGLLYRLSDDTRICWPAGKIVVAYSAGYALLDGLPHDIERACLSLIKQMRAQTTRDPMAKRIEIPDVMTTDYWVGRIGENGAMPPDVIDMLAPHVNWRL